jgi:hypothetical protein
VVRISAGFLKLAFMYGARAYRGIHSAEEMFHYSQQHCTAAVLFVAQGGVRWRALLDAIVHSLVSQKAK